MSRKEMAVVVGVLAATVAAVGAIALMGPAVALAEPAQQVNLALNARPGGDVSFRLKLRQYDTTGVVPPAATTTFVRFPAGSGIERAFLTRRYQCDGPALRSALDTHPSRVPFTRRIANLEPFIRELARSRSRGDRRALANVRVCEQSRIGSGTGLIDARNAVAVLQDPIPVRFTQFLSRGSVPGALAGVTVLGAADESAPVVKRYPVVAGVHVAITLSLVDEPTADGVYGLKVLLPVGAIAGFDVRIAEVATTVRSLVLREGTCLRRGRSGRCAVRQRRDLHSFVLPACPPAGELSAQMVSAFPPPLASLVTTVAVPCPAYSR